MDPQQATLGGVGAAHDAPDAVRARGFAAFFVVAGLFHVVNQIPWPKEPFIPTPARLATEVAMVAAAVWVLARPRDAFWPFLVYVAAAWLHGLREVPRVANHWWLTFLITSALLAYGVGEARRGGSLTRFVSAAAPAVRWLLLTGYAFAALAKFNDAFLDPEVSCASRAWVDIGTKWYTWLPTGPVWQHVAIFATLAVETALPVLLLTRRRGPAVVAGALFHFLISFTPILRVPDFCSLLFATWWLFLPDETMGSLARGRRMVPAWTTGRTLGAAVGAVALLALGQAAAGRFDPGQLFQSLRLTSFSMYGMTWMGAVALAVASAPTASRPVGMRLSGPLGAWAAVLVVVTVGSGLAPYVGLRTRASLAMFSNLRTEDHRPNHLFMPQTYLTDAQLDLVTIVETDLAKVRKETANGERLTWWELRYRAQEAGHGRVVYRRGAAAPVTVEDVADDAALMAPFAWWETRVHIFRPVDADGISRCQW
jgi:hypothetical protein